jgi:hypothetical protein
LNGRWLNVSKCGAAAKLSTTLDRPQHVRTSNEQTKVTLATPCQNDQLNQRIIDRKFPAFSGTERHFRNPKLSFFSANGLELVRDICVETRHLMEYFMLSTMNIISIFDKGTAKADALAGEANIRSTDLD